MCGCEVSNALYCFPCLLYGGSVKGGGQGVWNGVGFTNVGKISERSKKHESSESHINSEVSVTLLLSQIGNDRNFFSAAYQRNIDEHNEKVAKNRKVLMAIVKGIFFCGVNGVALRGHDERKESNKPGIFRSLLRYASDLDSDLRAHFQTSTVFQGHSKTIQNKY